MLASPVAERARDAPPPPDLGFINRTGCRGGAVLCGRSTGASSGTISPTHGFWERPGDPALLAKGLSERGEDVGPKEKQDGRLGEGQWDEGGSKAAKGGGSERSDLQPRAPSSRKPQSAAAPSPFPPIADYGFLSNCHTGALIAPDGAVDWLCVPSFDSPSIFASLLDREAGSFRMGPFVVHVPAARSCEPGTNTLATTWHTPTGWILVRDALTMGPAGGEGEVTSHTRPPTDDDGDHMLVRTVICLVGSVEVELICEPVFDYGRTPAQWSLVEDDRHVADATGAEQTVRRRTDMALASRETRSGRGTS